MTVYFNCKDASAPSSTYEQPFIDQLNGLGYSVTLVSDGSVKSRSYTSDDFLIIRADGDSNTEHPEAPLDEIDVHQLSMNRHTSRFDYGIGDNSEGVAGSNFDVYDESHEAVNGRTGTQAMYSSDAAMQRVGADAAETTRVYQIPSSSDTGGYLYRESETVSGSDRHHWAAHRGADYVSNGWGVFDDAITWIQPATQPLGAQTNAATDITHEAATLNGEVTGLDGADSVDAYFEWRETGATTWTTTPVQTMSSTGAYSETITGLPGGTGHEFRAVVDDGSTTETGDTITFTTGESVSGAVVDSSQTAVEGADVYVVDFSNVERLAEATSESDGSWLTAVPAGRTKHVAVDYQDSNGDYHSVSYPYVD